MSQTLMVRLKRVYDPVETTDGVRVLVDRLWPRGVRRDTLALDLWLKELAPSPELRTWFHHEPDRFDAFRLRYREELQVEPRPTLVDQLLNLALSQPVTLLYAARDAACNHATVLAEWLLERFDGHQDATDDA